MLDVVLSLATIALLVWFASIALSPGRRLFTREVVHAWETALLVTDGELSEAPLPPGRYRVPPAPPLIGPERVIVRLPTGELEATTAAQTILTADRVQVKAVASVLYEVADPRAALEAAGLPGTRNMTPRVIEARLQDLLYRDAQLALRDVIGARTVEALLADREGLDADLAGAMTNSFASRGLKPLRVVVRDVILGTSLRRGYEAAEIARVEGAAALERARAETAALRSLANAARLTRDNPALLSLRLIQALERDGAKGLTLVLGHDGLPQAATPSEPSGPSQREG